MAIVVNLLEALFRVHVKNEMDYCSSYPFKTMSLSREAVFQARWIKSNISTEKVRRVELGDLVTGT